jgi:HEAT repeat protein
MGLFKPNIEKMQTRNNIKGLINALTHQNLDVQQDASEALGKIGKPAVPLLIEILEDTKSEGWVCAARAISMIGPDAKAAVPALTRGLNLGRRDPMQLWGAIALGNIGPDAKAAVPALIEVINHDSPNAFRNRAATALGMIGAEAKDWR